MSNIILQILGWLSGFLTLFGFYFNAKKQSACWFIWISSNITWIGYFLLKHDYPATFLNIILIGFNIYGMLQWRKRN